MVCVTRYFQAVATGRGGKSHKSEERRGGKGKQTTIYDPLILLVVSIMQNNLLEVCGQGERLGRREKGIGEGDRGWGWGGWIRR